MSKIIREMEIRIADLKSAARCLRREADEKNLQAGTTEKIAWELESLLDGWKSELPDE